MKPPEDVPASELYLKLQQSPSPNEVVDFPRKDADGNPVFQVRIFALSMDDHHNARLDGRQWVIDKLKKRGDSGASLDESLIKEMVGDAVARCLLQLAVRTVEPFPGGEDRDNPTYPLVFMRPEDMDTRLRAPELETLFRAYELVQHKYGPFEGNIHNEQDLNAWVKRLVEGAENFPTMRCDWLQLADLNTSLAHRVFTLSAALESLCQSLPPTLVSSLADLGIGIGLYGSPPARCLLRGVDLRSDQPTSSLEPSESSGDREPIGADRPVTTERAIQLSKDLTEPHVP